MNKRVVKEGQGEESFDSIMLNSLQQSIIDMIRKGEWIKVEYGTRIPIDTRVLREVYNRVDMERVMQLVKESVEQKMADSIINSMAQEVANDVKSIMSNRELREDLRATLRQKIRSAETALKEIPT